MDYGTQMAQASHFVATWIQIGWEIRMIGNQHPGHANFLVGPWCVGLLRSKIAYLSLLPNLSTWPPQVDALNCYG
jgi:hypothetical protein